MAIFSLATNERWPGKDGEIKEKTEWHRIIASGRLAEISEEYFKKGSLVYVEGRIATRDWETGDGEKRRIVEIISKSLRLLGQKADAKTPPAKQEIDREPGD